MSVAVLREPTRTPEAASESSETRFEYPGIPTTCDGAEAVVHVEINVTQAAPLVSWPNPPDLAYGNGLDAAELNATANVPGSFFYNPPAGTVLDLGAGQVLSLVFTPTLDLNHCRASSTNEIIAIGTWHMCAANRVMSS